jgi:hypothetical protein
VAHRPFGFSSLPAAGLAQLEAGLARSQVGFGERLVPDLLRGRGRSIGGDLDIGEEGYEQTIVTL